MRKVLRVKVNVLIENNRLELQKKQKEQQLANKKHEKYSYSHYEEPSLQLLPAKRSAQPHQRYATIDDPDTLFQMRFEELERSNSMQQSLGQLQKEQYYLNRILHELERKIKGARTVSFQRPSKLANSALVLPKVSCLPSDKENDDGNKYRLKKGERPYTLDCGQVESRVIEVPATYSEMVNLQTEYAHLTAQLARLTGDYGSLMEGSIILIEKDMEQTNKLLRERKRQISDLKADIGSKSKALLKQTLTKEQLKFHNDQINALQAEIFKRKTKDKDKRSFLKTLQSKAQRDAQRQQNQIEQPSITKMLSIPNQVVDVSTVQSTNSGKVTKKTTHIKVKHLTTLEMEKQLTPEEEMTILIKKKKTTMKAIQTDSKKFKQVYTEKIRKMVGRCTNVKALQSLMERLEGSKEGMEVLKYRNAVTDS